MFAAVMTGGDRSHARGSRLGERFRASARNALEIARFGRLGGEYGAPFAIVDRGPHHRLRRYAGASEDAPVALLVPPLMVTADIYDIAPDISAVAALIAQGVAPWVVDFGAPEHEDGGMHRSLDDHVRAVVQAIARTRELTGRDVHLCGYSQGGMFAYQSAAYLRGAGIASIVTFGSPVDIHKNLPAVRSDLTGALVRSLFPMTKAALAKIEGLPGKLTSTAFKVLSTKKEVKQRIEFLRSLHDRERITKREARRLFIKGAGFVAWPGPAFRDFVEDFVVYNRMLSGGFVIDGRAVSLADLSCPILAFVGAIDELARPPTVRAIADAAPDAAVRFVTLRSGHFGLVVGSRAMATTWPTVSAWITAIERGARAVDALPEITPGTAGEVTTHAFDAELDRLVDAALRGARGAWRRLGDILARASGAATTVRWREPRLRRLSHIAPDTRISPSLELAARARESPDATFFLWRGRAFSYADADARVTSVARVLYASGVRPGDRVGVLMGSHPSLLTVSTALGRLGAVAVIAPANALVAARKDAFARLDVRRVVVDPERAGAAATLGLEVLNLDGGDHARGAIGSDAHDGKPLGPIAIPAELELDPGRARDVAHILLRPSEDDGGLRPVPITNHRWALSAIGAATACTVTPGDTVLCAVPLHHPTGMLVSVGAALVGGGRLALADLETARGQRAVDRQETANAPLDARRLLLEIRRVGATVVFYAGEMLRPLLAEPASRADRHLPVRIFAGSRMRPLLAAQLRERFGVDTMEFYAGTAHRAIFADPAGDAPGSLGGVLPGSADVALVRCDLARRACVVDPKGRLVVASHAEPALLAVRVSEDEIATFGDTRGLVRDAFGDGATWLVTNDVLERDIAGRHWFVDALTNFVAPPDGEPVSLRRIEDAFFALPEVRLVAAWERAPAGELAAAFVSSVAISPARLTEAMAALPAHARPTLVVRVSEIPLTEGFRPNQRAAIADASASPLARWELIDDAYVVARDL